MILLSALFTLGNIKHMEALLIHPCKVTRLVFFMLILTPYFYAAEEHASAPSFKSDQATSTDPASTGKDFQPGSWKP